jgi:Sensors of blue-light using FAD.
MGVASRHADTEPQAEKGPDMELYRIIYASRAEGVSKQDINDILAACERNNPRRHITGMLLFDNGHFLQLLEGRRAAVSERLLKIARDPRHHDLEVLTCGPIDARLFTDWSMHHVVAHGARALCCGAISAATRSIPSRCRRRLWRNSASITRRSSLGRVRGAVAPA